MMMNHSSWKPTAAPSFGVTISSPEPTMTALMIRPGPSCFRMPGKLVGAGRVVTLGGESGSEVIRERSQRRKTASMIKRERRTKNSLQRGGRRYIKLPLGCGGKPARDVRN